VFFKVIVIPSPGSVGLANKYIQTEKGDGERRKLRMTRNISEKGDC